MRVYGSPDNQGGPPSSSSLSSNTYPSLRNNDRNNHSNMNHDEEYAEMANENGLYHRDQGDRVPLLHSGRVNHGMPSTTNPTSPRGLNGGGGGWKRKLKIVPRPVDTGNDSGGGDSRWNYMKAVVTATVILIVALASMGYVYNSVNTKGSPVETIENFDVKESASTQRGEVVVAKDSLYDVCKLNTHSQTKQPCRHSTTAFTVLGNEDGRWPVGFSWTVLKDEGEESEDQRSFLHTERGEFDLTKTHGNDVQCKKFVTELCLSGDYIVYANSDHKDSANSAVNVCNKKVVADEALDFSADRVKCSSASFELNPDFSELKNNRNKHATFLQALSMSGASGASMMSGALSGTSMDVDGSMPVGSMTSAADDDRKEPVLSGGGNETVAPGNESMTSSNETAAASGSNDTIPGESSGETPPTVRPTTTYEYFFPPPLVPTAAPTPISSLSWDGSPPTIEQAWNYTKGNVSKTFTEDIPNTFTQKIPEKWDQTTQGFKYPTTAPTAPPSNADGSTPKPTTIGEWFYPPTVSVPLNQAYDNITNHDYDSDWNNTVHGFTFPTAAPTIYPTVRPTVEGEVNNPDCYFFGMVCDTPVSQRPSAEPTVAIAAGDTGANPAPVTTPPNLRAKVATSLAFSEMTTTWDSMLKFVGLRDDKSTEPSSSAVKSMVEDPHATIAAADKIAAAPVKQKSLKQSAGFDDKESGSYSKNRDFDSIIPLTNPSGGVMTNAVQSMSVKKGDSVDSKLSHHRVHGTGGGAAVVEVVDVVAQKTKEGVEKAEPIAQRIASNTAKKVENTLTETRDKLKSESERKSHKKSRS